MCIDTDYYEAYNRDNVRLVSVAGTPIERITERGLVVAGRELELRHPRLATGFDAMTGALLAVDPRGRGNLALREKWRDGPRSYLGLTMTDFPTSSRSRGPAARPCSAT